MHKTPTPKTEQSGLADDAFLTLTESERFLQMRREIQELRSRLAATEEALAAQEPPEDLEMPQNPVRYIRAKIRRIPPRPFVFIDDDEPSGGTSGA